MLCAMKAVVLLASLVVLVAIVSACGGAEESSDQPTAVQETSVEDEYFRQVGDAFQQAKEQMEALEISSEGSPIAREDLLTTFRVYYHGHLEVARSMRDKLQAIDSPAQFNEAHNAAIGAINELIAMVQNLSQLADGADPQTLPDSELVSGTLLIPYRVREACLGLQRLLHGKRGVQSEPRRGKRRKERVARRLEHMATVRLDALTQDDIVSCECDLHRLRRVFPQAGAALDVRRQERQHAGRQRRRGSVGASN